MISKNYQNLLHKELSYQVQGAAIEVRKNFGPGHKESLYQNAFAEELGARGIKFEREKNISIRSPKTGAVVGHYRPDFVVDDKIVVELKAVEKIPRIFIDQLYDYLRNSEYELGYFINFSSPKLYSKRVIFTNDRKFSLKKALVAISLILVFFSVSSAKAAEFNITSTQNEIGINGQMEVTVKMDTQNEKINAIEGKLVFPEDLLELKEIRDGNSVINFWIERPNIPQIPTKKETNGDENISGDSCGGSDNSCNFVSFSGVIPGGYEGKDAPIFSVIFTAKKEGSGTIKLEEAHALLNDGSGTPVKVSLIEYPFVISADGKAGEVPKITDSNPPESFVPEVGSNSGIFDGKYFVAFVTQDKGSGVDYYEVKEKWWPLLFLPFIRGGGEGSGKWQRAESPFELRDQRLGSYIYVRAVDKFGNERTEVIYPRPVSWYESRLFWCIIVLVVPAVFFIVKIWRRRKHQKTLI